MATLNSAAERALSVSELLGIVFLSLEEDRSSLAACMRVNKQWMSEAVRLLWARCGAGQWQHYPALRLQDLVALAPYPERQQWYASFIRELYPSAEWVRYDVGGKHRKILPASDGKVRHESQYHWRLKNVDFPHLQSLFLKRPSYDQQTPNSAEQILNFLTPTLREVHVHAPCLPRIFFTTLKTQCCALEKLCLSSKLLSREKGLDGELEAFLLNTPTLQAVRLSGDNFAPWSEKVFRALALHHSLVELSVPKVLESWALSIRDVTPKPFPALRKLSMYATDSSFGHLAPAVRRVHSISLSLSGPSSKVIQTVSTLPALKKLFIDPGEAGFTFHAEDLLAVARNCPLLTRLALAMGDYWDAEPFFGEGFSDAVMDEIARGLPNLEYLIMVVDHEETLTEKTILSLGKWCKKLYSIATCADVDFWKFVNVGENNVFRKLHSLRIIHSPSGSVLRCVKPGGVVERLRAMAPQLRYLIADSYDPGCWSGNSVSDEWDRLLDKEGLPGMGLSC